MFASQTDWPTRMGVGSLLLFMVALVMPALTWTSQDPTEWLGFQAVLMSLDGAVAAPFWGSHAMVSWIAAIGAVVLNLFYLRIILWVLRGRGDSQQSQDRPFPIYYGVAIAVISAGYWRPAYSALSHRVEGLDHFALGSLDGVGIGAVAGGSVEECSRGLRDELVRRHSGDRSEWMYLGMLYRDLRRKNPALSFQMDPFPFLYGAAVAWCTCFLFFVYPIGSGEKYTISAYLLGSIMDRCALAGLDCFSAGAKASTGRDARFDRGASA